jgi:hypothetical protein
LALRKWIDESGHDAAAALSVAVVVFLAHAASPIVTSFDSRWSIHTAASLVHRGDVDLDEYEHLLRENEDYAIERRGDHAYTRYPMGASLFAGPAVVALDLASRVLPIPDTEQLIEQRRWGELEVVGASVIVAATAAILFLIARRCGLGTALSLLGCSPSPRRRGRPRAAASGSTDRRCSSWRPLSICCCWRARVRASPRSPGYRSRSA